MPGWKADERLYLDATKTEVLREGDVRARSLLCGLGTLVPEDICRKYHIGPFAEAVETTTDNSDTTGGATADAVPTGEESTTDAAKAQETAAGDDSGGLPRTDELTDEDVVPPAAPAAVPPDKPVRKR